MVKRDGRKTFMLTFYCRVALRRPKQTNAVLDEIVIKKI